MMTNPDYVQEVIMHQREDTRLHRTREYWKRLSEILLKPEVLIPFQNQKKRLLTLVQI